MTTEPYNMPIENRVPGQPPNIMFWLALFTGPDGEILELIQCKDL